MTFLVVIVPPEDVNGDMAVVPKIQEAIEKVCADQGVDVQVQVVLP